MDIVFLRGLRIETTIGIYDWEKQIKQPVVLDLEMGADVARGAATDRIEDALDYKRVSKRLKEFVAESRFELVETLAERCAALLREEFGVYMVGSTRVNLAGINHGNIDHLAAALHAVLGARG